MFLWCLPIPQTNAKDHQQDPENQRIPGDHPNDGEAAGCWLQEEKDSQANR
jgi:hypothetical protein